MSDTYHTLMRAVTIICIHNGYTNNHLPCITMATRLFQQGVYIHAKQLTMT